MIAEQDKVVSREQLGAWREHTSHSSRLKMLPGDHFFLRSNQALLLTLLSQKFYQVVEKYLQGSTASCLHPFLLKSLRLATGESHGLLALNLELLQRM